MLCRNTLPRILTLARIWRLWPSLVCVAYSDDTVVRRLIWVECTTSLTTNLNSIGIEYVRWVHIVHRAIERLTVDSWKERHNELSEWYESHTNRQTNTNTHTSSAELQDWSRCCVVVNDSMLQRRLVSGAIEQKLPPLLCLRLLTAGVVLSVGVARLAFGFLNYSHCSTCNCQLLTNFFKLENEVVTSSQSAWATMESHAHG